MRRTTTRKASDLTRRGGGIPWRSFPDFEQRWTLRRGSGGTLAAGNNSTGNFTVASLILASGSTARFEINGTGIGQYDTVTSSGGFNFNGTLQLVLGTALADGSTLDLFLGSSTSGNFTSVTLTGGGYATGSFDNGGSGTLWTSIQNGQTLTFDATLGILSASGTLAIPEPAAATLLLSAASLLMTLGVRRRR